MNQTTPPKNATHYTPTDRELRAYGELVKLVRVLARVPTAEEAWPHVRDFKRFRTKDHVATSREDTTGARPRAVRACANSIIRRVSGYLAGANEIAELRLIVARQAFSTALEVLTEGGAYDDNAKLAKVKAESARDMLRVTGLSEEADKGTSINLSFGQPVPQTELEKVRQQREQLRKEQLVNRLGPASPN